MSFTEQDAVCQIYGIKNCDTMKKAFNWCAEHGVEYKFHDYKKEGVDSERLAAWCKKLGWQALVNTKGPTWRKLTPEQQNIRSQAKAIALMIEYPSLIRRPMVEARDGRLFAGFDPITFESFLR